MDGIRLQNVRSLADTGLIRLRPLTLLLGQNSSGKSTVLRSLPLVSQSLKTRSNAPVLWYGESVDFGSVKEVRSTFAPDQTVKIELDMGEIVVRSRVYYPGQAGRYTAPFRIMIELDEVDTRTKLRAFEIRSDDDVLRVTIDGRGSAVEVLVNSENYTPFLPGDRYRFIASDFVPQLRILPTSAEDSAEFYDPYRRTVDTAEKAIRSILSSKLHGRTSEEKINAQARRLKFQPGARFLKSLPDLATSLKSWKAFATSLASPQHKDTVDKLRALSFISNLPDILYSIDREARSVANSISYIGPSRATGERYYRIQELAVDQIDPQGKNLAMFLDSLSQQQLRLFSDWLLNSIGYALKISRSTGHIQIELRERSSKKYYNIADMGYGFSQVLPIMAQVWGRPTSRVGPTNQRFFAMEQPELHLHPAYQARLADVFAGAIRSNKDNRSTLRFLVETHSESLINRLGELISEGFISPEDIAIYVFEKDYDDEVTRIRPVSFETDGTLSNWPIGFFSAGPTL